MLDAWWAEEGNNGSQQQLTLILSFFTWSEPKGQEVIILSFLCPPHNTKSFHITLCNLH